MNEPKRHHYIPQFILRNFCFDNANHLYYFDKKDESVSIKETREVFMTPNLYRDEINHPENKTKLERDFAVFEREVAEIIKGRFICDSDIVISKDEEEKLRFFFALMGFRSKNTSELFDNLSVDSKKFYKQYQDNGDFTDLWKRNLEHLANCRSLDDVIADSFIDEPIKMFMQRDTKGITGKYISVVSCEEPYEFVISDAYPVEVRGDLINGVQLEIYSVYPISPQRAIIVFCEGADRVPEQIRDFRQCIYSRPFPVDEQRFRLRVRKLYDKEIGTINKMLIQNAKIGVAYHTDCEVDF